MWPSDSESTTNIFAGPRDAPLSVCFFRPPLSSNNASVERWGFASVAPLVRCLGQHAAGPTFSFSCDPCDSCPPPSQPTPGPTPTELVPPDDDSVDCSGSRLMSAAARFVQGAAGGMWQRAQGSSPSSDCLLGTHLLTPPTEGPRRWAGNVTVRRTDYVLIDVLLRMCKNRNESIAANRYFWKFYLEKWNNDSEPSRRSIWP